MIRGGSLVQLRNEASKGTCALLSPIPAACVAFYALEALEMVRAAGNAPACSCSRSRRLTFRLRPGKVPKRTEPSTRPGGRAPPLQLCEVSAGGLSSLGRIGRASGYRTLYCGLEGPCGRPSACFSQHLCSATPGFAPERFLPVRSPCAHMEQRARWDLDKVRTESIPVRT